MKSFHQRAHSEHHRTHRVGSLRAAVLGANDGIISTASLVAGVAAAQASHTSILMTAVAGMAAGAMSMAAGEFVSVYSQADTEAADLERERAELHADPDGERRELVAIYMRRGLDRTLSLQVATQLMAHDALAAHARDELGITEAFSARPLQAAAASAASFSAGAALPLLVVLVAPTATLVPWTMATSIAFLALLGACAARIGDTSVVKSVWRVTFWGTLAMGITAAIGTLFGTSG
ncbi:MULTISPECIES: VIT family protein [unclassified Variovorax]|uniref:VIT1/CCC1 transporter family protein n=1 Tax=unclassified Variovorax TaxID=663243 RepID=UPI0008C8D079|nr:MULTISPECIES: VIT family protein [unclassified Variovorax]SEK17170.1 Predicted Fe2+/Mn2+ transporter, VIT1/CCC1 family [Variovorax sp. OK202]SFE74661.1 Predicted Fe2+/Mn2+ transporter, VIT1/CCC1 family [Variovorax sp. OK212]